MLTEATILTPSAALRVLRRTPAGQSVLTAYLDTSPERMRGQGALISFIDACKAIRPSVAPTEREAFEQATAQAEGYLRTQVGPSHPGLALFASGQASYFYAVPLPYRPLESTTWDRRPPLEPLRKALDEYERIAVMLFDHERARLFTVFLGAIETEAELQDEVPNKHAGGGWFALEQTRIARHRDVHVAQHVEHAIATLMELLRTHPFDRLLLGGPVEALSVLREHLPQPLRVRLVGTLHLELFANNRDILQAALEAATATERKTELAEVNELLDAASSRYVVLGLDDTLAALGDRRVHTLFIAEDCAGEGAECQSCGRLVPRGGRCLWCDGPVAPVPDLLERMESRAVEQGARVELVFGEAARRLLEHGGVGAWTRY